MNCLLAAAAAWLLLLIGSSAAAFAALGELELRVVDRDTVGRSPCGCTFGLQRGCRAKSGASQISATTLCFMDESFCGCRLGSTDSAFERGCEYLEQTGNFLIRSAARDNKTLEIKRFVSMRDQGWLAADLFVRRPASQYAVWAASEDLDLLLPVEAPAPRHSGDLQPQREWEARILPAPLWDANGQLLALCNFDHQQKPELLSDDLTRSGSLLKLARGMSEAVCVAADVRAIDLPMWVASNRLDAVVVMQPEFESPSQSTEVVTPDGSRFPGTRGLARFREYLYYQLLESGIQLTPLACSRSGDATVPLGSIRTYAWKGTSSDPEQTWWQAVRDGQVLLTAGPILIARANDRLPGWVFTPSRDAQFQLEFSATLHTRRKISYLEIIKNGAVAHTVPLDDWVAAHGKLPPVPFEESGWALLRAVIDADDEYQYAMSGPYYVHVEGKPRISRAAVRFFQDWATKRRDELQQLPATSGLTLHRGAVKFWEHQESEANAD